MASIGEVSRKSGLKIPTIRFYEAEGLIAAPQRGTNGRRQYTHADVQRLTFIRQAREIGFELSDVRALLDLNDHPDQASGSARKIVRRHLHAVATRIDQLNRLKKGLAGVARARRRAGDAPQQPLIEALVGRTRHMFEQYDFERHGKTKVSPPWGATQGYAMQHQATGGNAKVGPEPRTFCMDTVSRLIERNPEYEKLFVARGLQHPVPEVRWRKKL